MGAYITGLDKQKNQHNIVNISLPINLSICFGCSKKPSRWEQSFDCPQHMFWLRNKNIIFLLHALIWTLQMGIHILLKQTKK